MQTGYFKSAWDDIRRSEGWLKKLLLLALVSCIPIFGWMVVFGYLFGWARDMAWGVHGPLPSRIFGNEDGRLYVRGASVFAISLIYSLLPAGVYLVGVLLFGSEIGHMGLLSGMWSRAWSWWFVGFVLSVTLGLISLAASVLAVLFSWIGGMRASIYGRVSAGFQWGRIWAMLRHDSKGILRIFGMVFLMTALGGLLISLVVAAVAFFLTLGGCFAFDDVVFGLSSDCSIASVAFVFLSAAMISVIAVLAISYLMALLNVTVCTFCARAMGYWTMQFDVARWRGQEDPLPFEADGNM